MLQQPIIEGQRRPALGMSAIGECAA